MIWFLAGGTRASCSSVYINVMKEALHFQEKPHRYTSTAYLTDHVACWIPGTVLLTVLRPRFVFVRVNA